MSSTSSHPLSTRSSRDYLDSWSPSVTNRSIPFWSPAVTEARSLSSATSIGSTQTQAPFTGAIMKTSATPSVETMSSIERLRRHVTSLLLSDLGSVLFANGSETDHAFWTGVGGDVTAKHFRSVQPDLRGAMDEDATKSGFDFDNAFEKLIKRLSLSLVTRMLSSRTSMILILFWYPTWRKSRLSASLDRDHGLFQWVAPSNNSEPRLLKPRSKASAGCFATPTPALRRSSETCSTLLPLYLLTSLNRHHKEWRSGTPPLLF